MKIFIMFLLLLLIVIACKFKADKLIPASSIADAVPHIQTTIKKLDTDHKSGGMKAIGAVPFNIKRGQVRPSLLGVMKMMIQNFPDQAFIIVELGPDMEMAQEGSLVGKATYEEGQIKIIYGIPSEKQMEEYNAHIGRMEPGGILGDDFKHPVLNDGPRLFVPDENTYLKAKKIYLMVSDKRYIKDDLDYRYKVVSKAFGESEKQIKRQYLYFLYYYGWCLSGNRGEEIIIPR